MLEFTSCLHSTLNCSKSAGLYSTPSRKRDVHRRLAKWMIILPKHKFETGYNPEACNFTASFLSQYKKLIDSLDGSKDNRVLVWTGKKVPDDLEPSVMNVWKKLCQTLLSRDESTVKKTKIDQYNFPVWGKQLFRRTLPQPKVVFPYVFRVEAVNTFHNLITYWEYKSTRQLLIEWYWWPTVY